MKLLHNVAIAMDSLIWVLVVVALVCALAGWAVWLGVPVKIEEEEEQK